MISKYPNNRVSNKIDVGLIDPSHCCMNLVTCFLVKLKPEVVPGDVTLQPANYCLLLITIKIT